MSGGDSEQSLGGLGEILLSRVTFRRAQKLQVGQNVTRKCSLCSSNKSSLDVVLSGNPAQSSLTTALGTVSEVFPEACAFLKLPKAPTCSFNPRTPLA